MSRGGGGKCNTENAYVFYLSGGGGVGAKIVDGYSFL